MPIKPSKAVVQNRGRTPLGRRQINPRVARALACSTRWKFFQRECVPSKHYAIANFTLLHVICFSSGRDGVKFLATLQANVETAYKHSEAQLRGLFSRYAVPSPFDNNICAVLAFENTMVHIEFEGNRLHRRAARLIPDKGECIHFAELHAAWNTTMAFCNSTSFLQCGRTPAW